MTTLRDSIIGAGIGTAVLAFSALSASAAIVCSGNVCWHTPESHRYPPEARVIVIPTTGRGVLPNTSLGGNMRGAVIGMGTTGWNSRSSATATR